MKSVVSRSKAIKPDTPTVLVSFFLLALFCSAADVNAQDLRLSTAGVKQAARVGPPRAMSLKSAGSTMLDLREIKRQKPQLRERPEREPPPLNPVELPGYPAGGVGRQDVLPGPAAAAPSPIANFAGLDLSTWGSGWPPDTVGDVGPDHYIQSVNSSVGIYDKATGVQLAAFTLNAFFSLGSYGNLCDTYNFGDPVILYDSFADRWVVSDFAFQLDPSNNVVNPPGSFECIAVSKSGDPVAGGWNFYFLNTTDGLNDYPKLGIWPDGIYLAANMFDFEATGGYQRSRVWALNKAQMYAGDPVVQVVAFDAPASEFTLLPANARLQTGTPPAGTPNYFSVVWQYLNVISFYKFHVDWDSISLSSFTGPFLSFAPASWSVPPGTVAVMDGVNVDTLGVRLMMQNQYTNIAGAESLWNVHTVQGGAPGTAAPRYYQVDVTGGNIAASTTQAATHTPDTTVNRFMPSLAVNRDGDMAMGYSAASSTLFPAIRYAGRLSTDSLDTLPQTETSLIEGTGAQTVNSRWGDYSAMSLDPDGCTFWYTNEYYADTGGNWQTRIGSFRFPDCISVASGTVEGTVTATSGGAPIVDAAVSFASRSTTTDAGGFYQFTDIPSGTYPGLDVAAPGFDSGFSGDVVVTDGGTTVLNFSLDNAPTSACPVDTSEADFLTGIPVDVDLTSSPGDVELAALVAVDQQNTNISNSGFGFDSTAWAGQTFTAGVSGQILSADVYLFCSECSGTTPDITVSVRATTGGLPSGPDLATGSIAGFSTGAGDYFPVSFDTPVEITAGTIYAIVIRADSDPSAGTYAAVESNGNPYLGGQYVTSNNSGAGWNGNVKDLGFHIYVTTGFAASGNLVSSLKDSNPAAESNTEWSTLSWNATLPANTTLGFQVAASNFASGPFNFVGPDGTPGTTYTTSGGSLAQFNGYRYLRYQAWLATTDTGVTPTLHDVTSCYDVVSVSDVVLVKNASPLTYDTPGQAISYTYDVSNNGVSVLTGPVSVVDDKETVVCPALTGIGNLDGNLDPGETLQCNASHTVAQGDIDAGSIVNIATATVDGVESNQDSETVTAVQNRSVGLVKAATPGTYDAPGQLISYTYDVTNTGNTALAGPVTVVDDRETVNCPALSTTGNNDGSLDPGETLQCTATHTVGQGDIDAGSIVNLATATVDAVESNQDSETVTAVQVNSITLLKTAAPDTYSTPGQVISYTYDVTNNGNTVLAGPVSVSDDKESVNCPALSGIGNHDGNLDPGESVQCTASHTVVQDDIDAGSIVNLATATVDTVESNQDTETATKTDTSADLSIAVTDNLDDVAPGGSVTYTIVAGNNGPDAVTDAGVTDNFPAGLTCTYTSSADQGVSGNTASGAGDIADTLAMEAGAGATYIAICDVAADASGVLSNTATIASSAGDPVPGNNADSDLTNVVDCIYMVSQPAGGETWRLGETHTVNWNGTGSGCAATVKIDLYQSGVFNRIIAAATGDTMYTWVIPPEQSTGADFRVRVSDTDAPGIQADSAADFTIALPLCRVTTAAGVSESSAGMYEACETLVVGPGFSANNGASVILSSGLDILFLPEFLVEKGATLDANVCGLSLCEPSASPMPQGCHSCVVQICDIDPACCDTAFDQSCVDKVSSVCSLACE